MKEHQTRYLALSTELLGLIIFSIYLGNYLDKKFNLNGIALISLLFSTFILWIGHVLWLGKQAKKDSEGS